MKKLELKTISDKILLEWLEATRGPYGYWSNMFPQHYQPEKEKYGDVEKICFMDIQSELRARSVEYKR